MTAWAPPSKTGDVSVDIGRAKAKLRAFSYGAAFKADASNTYNEALHNALVTFAQRRNAEIAKGTKPKPVVNTTGVLDWAMKKQLGLLDVAPAPPPPPRHRHAWLVFRGTGGIIGEDYVSRVCQNAADLVEEINPDFPASMGGLPPGAPGLPSARVAINIGFESGCRWIEANPHRTFGLGGYSLGAIVAAMLRAALEPGGRLAWAKPNYVGTFTIGDPARPENGGAANSIPAPGVGISSWRLPRSAMDERQIWLVHPDDMYGAIPKPMPGNAGDIMETVFDMIVDTDISDPIGMMTKSLPHILEIAQDSGVFGMIGLGSVGPVTGGGDVLGGLGGLLGGGGSGGLLGGLLGGGSGAGGLGALGGILGGAAGLGGLLGAGGALLNPVAAIPLLLPMFISVMPGLIAGLGSGASANTATGPAGAAQAAILGMKFLFTGTAPHVNYHAWEISPGVTYLGAAIGHVRYWAGRTPVRV